MPRRSSSASRRRRPRRICSARPEGLSGVELTVFTPAIVAVIMAVFGALVAWVVVRDDLRGKAVVDSVVGLPFVLPTVVGGLVLIARYGPKSAVYWNVYGTRT